MKKKSGNVFLVSNFRAQSMVIRLNDMTGKTSFRRLRPHWHALSVCELVLLFSGRSSAIFVKVTILLGLARLSVPYTYM